MELTGKRILFADLDGTLIQTASGKTFAENFGIDYLDVEDFLNC